MKTAKQSITITIPLHIAETLYSYIDGGIGTSGSDLFSEEMHVVRRKLEKAINKNKLNYGND